MITLSLLVLAISYLCYYLTFYVSKRKHNPVDIIHDPMFDPYRKTMRDWAEEAKTIPHTDVSITSFDGLTLCGKYYECDPSAPVELLMHGYRGTAERDLCGGVQRCFALGRNALLVDQRACGKSGGKTISFGVNESKDCRSWIDFLIQTKGEDVKIILCGISMGASTVLIAAGEETLPPQVVGVLADCGYTTAREIIYDVIRGMHLPPRLCYPFVALGARIFGKFRLESVSALDAVGRTKLPILFIHGEADTFVPHRMSQTMYEQTNSRKAFFSVPKAGHGMSYLLDAEGYVRAVREFFSEK